MPTIQERAREFCFASDVPLGCLDHKAAHGLMADFATLEVERAVREREMEIANELAKVLDDDLSLAHNSLCEIIDRLRKGEVK